MGHLYHSNLLNYQRVAPQVPRSVGYIQHTPHVLKYREVIEQIIWFPWNPGIPVKIQKSRHLWW